MSRATTKFLTNRSREAAAFPDRIRSAVRNTLNDKTSWKGCLDVGCISRLSALGQAVIEAREFLPVDACFASRDSCLQNIASEGPNMPEPLQSTMLQRIARGDLCAGCGACAGVFPEKITMEMLPPGFPRPHQTKALSETEDAALAHFCPAFGQKVEAKGRTDHVLWGPYLEMHTGWTTDPELRFAGASGGAASMHFQIRSPENIV